MHALPSHPRHPLVAGLVALFAAVMFLLAVAPAVPTIDLSFGGGTSSGAADVGPAVPAQPTWFTDPIAAPLETLAARP